MVDQVEIKEAETTAEKPEEQVVEQSKPEGLPEKLVRGEGAQHRRDDDTFPGQARMAAVHARQTSPLGHQTLGPLRSLRILARLRRVHGQIRRCGGRSRDEGRPRHDVDACDIATTIVALLQ